MTSKSIFINFLKGLFSLFLLCTSFSLTTLAQTMVTLSKPGTAQYFDTAAAGTWNHTANFSYTYDNFGRLIQRIATKPVTGQNTYKEVFYYNAKNIDTLYYSYYWNNNNWLLADGIKKIVTYDTNNLLTDEIIQYLIAGVWENDIKWSYTYNTLGQQTEFQLSIRDNGTWKPNRKTLTTYANGLKTEVTDQVFIAATGTFENRFKTVYSSWHVPNELPLSYITQMYNPSYGWRNTGKYDVVYDPLGGSFTTFKTWVNNAWSDFRKTTLTKNNQGLITQSITEELKNGAWSLQHGVESLYTINANNDITELINRRSPNPYLAIRNQNRFVYSNFQYFTVAGLGKDKPQQISVKIYPNPTGNTLTIELAEQKPQALTTTVSDITGKTWLTKTLKAEENKQLNIEALPKGIYLLQLQNEAGITVKRIVKH